MVSRFLITGTEEQLLSFLDECAYLNPCERRENTVLCTMMSGGTYPGSIDEIKAAAAQFHVTVQLRNEDLPETGHKPEDYWPVIHQGELPAWTSTPGIPDV